MTDHTPAARSGDADAAIPFHDHLLLAGSAAPGFACGGCTVCCTVMAVVELQKPARRACDHVCPAGCRIYERRPQDCREFQCVWMRGAFGVDLSLRPDACGIMVDCFVEAGSGRRRLIALEVWNGAFADAGLQPLLERLAATGDLELSARDGSWRFIESRVPCDPA